MKEKKKQYLIRETWSAISETRSDIHEYPENFRWESIGRKFSLGIPPLILARCDFASSFLCSDFCSTFFVLKRLSLRTSMIELRRNLCEHDSLSEIIYRAYHIIECTSMHTLCTMTEITQISRFFFINFLLGIHYIALLAFFYSSWFFHILNLLIIEIRLFLYSFIFVIGRKSS